MAVYLRLFDTEAEYDRARLRNYYEPWTSLVLENESVDFNISEEEQRKRLQTPLTFEITKAGTIRWRASSTAFTKTIQYKKNSGEWTNLASKTGSTAPSVSVAVGDTVQFRGNNVAYASGSSTSTTYYNCFSGSTSDFKVYGNVMSLFNSTEFSGITEFSETSNSNLARLFLSCTGLTDASRLILPATSLRMFCYCYLFSGCTNLTTAPELPATTLANSCYYGMFQGCTSLADGPSILPATTLISNCYQSMFRGCTSLTAAPEISAMTVSNGCCEKMFSNCTSLISGPSILPCMSLSLRCYQEMFSNCTSLTSAPELPATEVASSCYYYMFSNCTSLTTAPELPAKLRYDPHSECYAGMFSNCSNLNYIKCLTIDNSSRYMPNWVSGVASSGTFIKDTGATWSIGVNGIPEGWTVQDA